MFCTKCGRELANEETYCPYCGQDCSCVGSVPYAAPDETLRDRMAGEALTWGILSLAFALSACLSLLGFIFSFTARKKVGEYRRVFGELEGRSRVGHILSWVGFGVGLGYTVFWILYFTIVAFVFGILAISGSL